MSSENYSACKKFTISQEGGYTEDPYDSGNWSSGQAGVGTLIGSNMGCGAPATIAYMALIQPAVNIVTAEWMQNLPESVYDGMAQQEYWMPLNCDNLPSGLDLMCFDFGWNTGVRSAALRLQNAVGVEQDGVIGPLTLAACSRLNVSDTIHKLGGIQNDYYKTLYNFDIYGNGWLNRTAARIEASLVLVG